MQKILGINELIEHTNIIDLGLIRDDANSMARQARRGAEIIAKIYKSQTGQANAPETDDPTGGGVCTNPQTSNTAGTSSAPPMAQSIPC